MNRRLVRQYGLPALFLASAVGATVYWLVRSPRPDVPLIDTSGLDHDVAALIQNARAEVLSNPDAAEAWGRLGLVLFAHQRYADSVIPLERAEQRAPADVRWPYLRGLALILNHPEAGIAALEKAATMPPRPFAVRLRLAEELLKLDRSEPAEQLFRELSAEDADHPRVLLGLGQIAVRRSDWQAAEAALRRAAEHPTAAHSARVALATMYLHRGDRDAANREARLAAAARSDRPWLDPFVRQAEELQTGLQPRIDRTKSLLQDGRTEEALALIRAVLRDHPRSDEAHLTLGRVLMKAGAAAEAEKALQRAISLNPSLVDGYFLLGGIALVRQQYAEAERHYLRAIELKPSYGLAHFNLGECRRRQGRAKEAVAAYRDAIRCRPDLAAAHLELGALLLDEGNISAAMDALEAALRLDDQNERARQLLAQARAHAGK